MRKIAPALPYLCSVKEHLHILAIESSCDDTSAAVLRDRCVLSNIVAGQEVHRHYGGVVPELASRAHQAHIVPVVHQALAEAGLAADDLDAVAVTTGPGLLGSLMVGVSFAKSLSLALNIPLLDVHHMKAHVLAHLIDDPEMTNPGFPFLCMTVSGGHTQIIRVDAPLEMTILGETIDDAAGEAFDKTAKLLGLPYPGGPEIDRIARQGNPDAFTFAKPHVIDLDFSFSGLKTSILYTIQKAKLKEPDFVDRNLANICASVQKTIVEILCDKLESAVKQSGIRAVAIAGGVSANTALREELAHRAKAQSWSLHIPPLRYTTDNAAMIGIAGYYLSREGMTANLSLAARARSKM